MTETAKLIADLTPEQQSIIHHTLWRAAGRRYCGSKSDPDIRSLVERGLMRDCGRPAFLPESDSYFAVTTAGREALKAKEAEND